ncbi:hypothetical protein [Iodidimonas gelatinilytica]|uniref:hypothetical protein n=1 Tax=Iodidimonas gelatinilytica TaxID=1236966 RepID=UPI0035310239
MRRYQWLATEMRQRHEHETAAAFDKLAVEEQHHMAAVAEWAQALGEGPLVDHEIHWHLPKDLAQNWKMRQAVRCLRLIAPLPSLSRMKSGLLPFIHISRHRRPMPELPNRRKYWPRKNCTMRPCCGHGDGRHGIKMKEAHARARGHLQGSKRCQHLRPSSHSMKPGSPPGALISRKMCALVTILPRF